MPTNQEIKLVRDTNATVIPAGDECVLGAGTRAIISQALGGSVTIRTDGGLFRIAGKDLDALGDEIQGELESAADQTPTIGADQAFNEDQVWEAMRACFDPEIPINVVDLGLIYDLQVAQGDSEDAPRNVQVKMTLTAQGCGMGPVIADDVKKSIEGLNSVNEAQVDIVWDPPWTPHMISETGRKKLGME